MTTRIFVPCDASALSVGADEVATAIRSELAARKIDAAIVRNAAKIKAVAGNAKLMLELAKEHGSAAKAFADWPGENLIGRFEMMKKRGDRLGGNTGQMFMRFMGKDGFVFSGDVVKALIREGVVDKEPTSKADLKAAQDAYNTWAKESGRPLMQISRTLAASVG